MTIKQILVKWLYPLIVGFAKNKAQLLSNTFKVKPEMPFYSLTINLNDGRILPAASLKGKKILIVNTASNCGYTPQYRELEQLYKRYSDQLVIIGFPANDFKEQEKGDDNEIKEFCQVNFGVTFPLAKKSVVTWSTEQNRIFEWLTKKELNGWNNQQPKWNFSKYLINEEGVLTHYFDPAISPLSKELIRAIDGKAG